MHSHTIPSWLGFPFKQTSRILPGNQSHWNCRQVLVPSEHDSRHILSPMWENLRAITKELWPATRSSSWWTNWNQRGQEGRGEEYQVESPVIVMSVDEADWPRVQWCCAHASAGLTVSLTGWPGKEKTLSLDFNIGTSSHASAPFPMGLYLKFMHTDSNDKAYQ